MTRFAGGLSFIRPASIAGRGKGLLHQKPSRFQALLVGLVEDSTSAWLITVLYWGKHTNTLLDFRTLEELVLLYVSHHRDLLGTCVHQETLLWFSECNESNNSVGDSLKHSKWKYMKRDPIWTTVIYIVGLPPCIVCFLQTIRTP